MRNLLNLLTNKFGHRYVFLSLFSAVILVYLAITTLPDELFHLKFYDVGQGDSILVLTPSGKKILVDGGPNNKVLNYLGKDLPFYDRKIDLVVLTHPHEDHLAGLVEVAKRYEIGEVWQEKVIHTTDTYLEWLTILKQKKIKVGAPKKGDSFSLGDGVDLKVLWPPAAEIDSLSDLNDTSIVLLLKYGSFKAMLTGDAGRNTQPYGLKVGIEEVDVLKVPHQGASTALSEEFLQLIKPKTAIISVGEKNRFGHPSEKTIQQLKDAGTKIYRTDTNGSIKIVSNGNGWYTRTER